MSKSGEGQSRQYQKRLPTLRARHPRECVSTTWTLRGSLAGAMREKPPLKQERDRLSQAEARVDDERDADAPLPLVGRDSGWGSPRPRAVDYRGRDQSS